MLYEGHFERLTGHAKTPLTHLYEFVHIIESLYPETRSSSSLPGILSLSSAQQHTVYLWIAVHRYILYLADPGNAGVKKLLDEEVACEKAFPGDVYPALTGQALYRSTEALEYRGRASNGHIAELTWAQVVSRDLSEALAMSEELVAAVEKGSNEEEENGQSNDADSDEEENGKLSLAFFSCFSILTRLILILNFKNRAELWVWYNHEKAEKKRQARLVDEASASTKLRARPTQPVKRAQPESSLSQPSPATTFKLKFPPKRPLPRPHKAFLQEKNAPEATNTGQEVDNKDAEKDSNSELSSIDPNKNKGEHEDLQTQSRVPTAQNIETFSSPNHASAGEKKEKSRGSRRCRTWVQIMRRIKLLHGQILQLGSLPPNLR